MHHVSRNFSELIYRVKTYAGTYALRWKSIDNNKKQIPQGDSGSTKSILLGTGNISNMNKSHWLRAEEEQKYQKFFIGDLFCPVSWAPYR